MNKKLSNNEIEEGKEEVAEEIAKPEGHTIGDYAADTFDWCWIWI